MEVECGVFDPTVPVDFGQCRAELFSRQEIKSFMQIYAQYGTAGDGFEPPAVVSVMLSAKALCKAVRGISGQGGPNSVHLGPNPSQGIVYVPFWNIGKLRNSM